MAVVTALRSAGRGSVRVELDGAAWRTLPLEVVVRAGLAAGCELDRPRARELRRQLRRHQALDASASALRRRDLSTRELEERLTRRRVAPAERDGAIETLTRAGVVDDVRFGGSRARVLAERGYGDAAIRSDLARRGVAADAVAEALASLEPERERAAAIVARRGGGVATARLLARRGFDEDAVEAAMAGSGGASDAGALP